MKGKGNKLMYVGQKAFIERDGQVLVLFEENIGLDFPGGKLHTEDNDIIASLKREVREETGLEVEVGEPFYAWLIKFPPSPDYEVNDVYLVGYKCKYVKGEVRLSDEHVKFQWVNKDNYQSLKDDRPHFTALEKYFSV